MRAPARAIAAAAVLAAKLAACEGSSPPAEEPKARAATSAKAKAGEKVDEAPAASRSGIECDDGSCFKCGEAVCLSGFYCSVGRSGKGCAWLPSCPGKATCACIGAALRDEPSCSCQEKESGVYVTCDGAKM